MSTEFRCHFTLPDDIIYLNASYLSPMPRLAAEAGMGSIERRQNGFWEVGQSDFFEPTEKLRALIAGLWGTLPRNIALVPSVSYGVECAVNALRPPHASQIVIPQDDFPSNVYPWLQVAKTTGAQVVAIQRPEDFNWSKQFLNELKTSQLRGGRLSVVSVPLTDWSDGSAFDLKSLSHFARDAGAGLVVDVSQSFGAQPIAVADFDPDFMFSVGYKWQLGPYGLSYLYVADRWLDAAPIENGWLNRKGSEDFTRLNEYRDEYQDGARRFDAGQRSQFHLTAMAIESMKLLQKLTPAKIQAHNIKLTAQLHSGLSQLGFSLPPIERLSGNILGARHRHWPDMNPLVKRLKDRRVFVSARGSALRVSPHLYNHEGEVGRFLEVLSEELGSHGARRENDLRF